MIGRKITGHTVSCKVIKPMPPNSINQSTSMQQPTINQHHPLQSQIQYSRLQSLSHQPLPISGRIFGVSKQTIEAEIDFGIENYNCFNRLTNDYQNKQSTNLWTKQQRPGGSRNVTQYFISNKEKPINMELKKIVHSAKNIPQTNIQIKNYHQTNIQIKNHQLLNQNENDHIQNVPSQIKQIKQMKQIKQNKQMKQVRKQPTHSITNHSKFMNTRHNEKSHNFKQNKTIQKRNIDMKQSQKSINKNQKLSSTSIVIKRKAQQQSNYPTTIFKINHISNQVDSLNSKPDHACSVQPHVQCEASVNVESFVSCHQKSGNQRQDNQLIMKEKQQIRNNPVIAQSKLSYANQQSNNKRNRQPRRYMSVKEEIQLELRKRADRQMKLKLDVTKSGKSHNLLFKKNPSYLNKSQQRQEGKLKEHDELEEQDEFTNREEEQIEQERRNVPEPIQEMIINQKISIDNTNNTDVNKDQYLNDNDTDKQHPIANALSRHIHNSQKQYIKAGNFNYVESSSDEQQTQQRIGIDQINDESNRVKHQFREQDEEYEDYQHNLQEYHQDNFSIDKDNNQTVHESSFCEQECTNSQPQTHSHSKQPISAYTNQKRNCSKQPQQQQLQEQKYQREEKRCQSQYQQQGSQQEQSQQDNPKLTEYLRQRNLISSNCNKHPKSINYMNDNNIFINNNNNILTNDQNILIHNNNIEVIVQVDEEYLQSSIIFHHSHSSTHQSSNHQFTSHNLTQYRQVHHKQQQPQGQKEVQENDYNAFASSSSDSQQLSHCITNYPAPSFITPYSEQVFLSQKDTTPQQSMLANKQFSQLFTLNIQSLLGKDFINLDR